MEMFFAIHIILQRTSITDNWIPCHKSSYMFVCTRAHKHGNLINRSVQLGQNTLSNLQ